MKELGSASTGVGAHEEPLRKGLNLHQPPFFDLGKL